MADFPGMRTVRIQDRPAQVYRGDLCVVGSGAGGLSAALEAVRLGQKVVIVDAAPHIGGQAVGAALGTICGLFRNGPAPRRLTHGVMDGLFDALFAQGDANLRRVRGTFILDYVPNAWMRWAERQIAETGIVPLPGAIVRQVEHRDGIVEALALSTRFGDARVEANRFIDASGDAVLPWLAGQELRESEKPVFGTVMAILEDVDTDLCSGYPRSLYHGLIREHGKEFGLVRAEGPVFVIPGTRKLLLNLTHVETPMETAGLALAGIEGRRQVDALLSLFQRELPDAFGEARVAVYGNAGLRQTRTIVGRSHVTVEDVATGARPPDAIARTTWPIEMHGDMAGADWTVFDEDHIHYIPFGAMVPEGLHNVVVAGRCIDAEPAALASLRVMGPCFAMGRAAATAAHLNASGSLHQIDIAALQDAVSDNLTRETTDSWAGDIVRETGPEAEGKGA
ncbi:MAG: FAD-dependent oxidoreductase [Rhodospirillaceae bacterium]|nr:FAD-dependent oxidoreductase [Rhodospirillaceae bacterium]